MESDAVFLSGLDVFGSVLHQVGDDAWENDSPCAGWTARDVAGHIVGVLDAGNAILRGDSPDWSGGPEHPRDVVGDDPVGRYDSASATARASLVGVDLDQVLDSPRGPRPIREGLSFPAMDLHLHAWDLGRAAGVEVEIAPEVQEFTRACLAPIPEEVFRSSGIFGPEQPVPKNATPTEAFVAWTGRQPR